MSTQPAVKPECVLNNGVLDRCTVFYDDGVCKRCGKQKGAK